MRRPEELSRQVSASVPVRGGEAGRTFPVSVKGVSVQAGKVLLLENERAEWELPGGLIEFASYISASPDPPGQHRRLCCRPRKEHHT